MLNRMNQERIWYQRIRKQSTPTVKTHNSIKTLRNDYNRLRTSLFISTAYLVPDVSLQDTRKHRVLRDAISTVLIELAGQEEP